MPDALKTAVQLREEQAAEYGTYVAVAPIDLDGVRAFNTGDPVPVSHVGRVVSEDQVAKTTTKAGREAVAPSKEG